MNDSIVVPQQTPWHKLKSLVLHSVSSPITKRVYNPGLDEFFRMVQPGAAARVHYSDGVRLARRAGSPRARRGFDQPVNPAGGVSAALFAVV